MLLQLVVGGGIGVGVVASNGLNQWYELVALGVCFCFLSFLSLWLWLCPWFGWFRLKLGCLFLCSELRFVST